MRAKKIQSRLLLILGGLLFLSIPILSSPDRDSGHLFQIAPFQRHFLSYILLLGFFYANYFYFIPKFYFSKSRILFFSIVIISYAIVALLPRIVSGEIGQLPNIPPPDFPIPTDEVCMEEQSFNFWPFVHGGSLIQFVLIFFLSFLLRINQRLSAIQSEKLRTEVSYLKAQINPHFLFNTLNSLYALALEKSDAAPEAILKLSSMMRYVVSESSNDTVPLEHELNYIKNYISLQQLRMDGGTAFSFIVIGSPAGKNIPPMLLIPFIENAFKYGLNPEEDADITINIDINESNIILRIKNNKVNVAVAPEEKSEQGIENTTQRLEHLYGGKHELTIFDTETSFEVILTLPLS